MPVSCADLVDPVRTIKLSARGRTLTITYRLERVSVASALRWQQIDQQALIEMLAELITEWDLVGPLPSDGSVVPEGEPVPLTPEVIAYVPNPLLNWIVQEIVKDASGPNLLTAEPSRPG